MSTSPETVTAAALRARLETEAITLLDVRRHADAVADPAGIPGAVWRDPSNIDDWADTLPRDRPVALYCVRGGGVSQGAADALAAKGHAVLRLEGGLEAWKTEAAPPIPLNRK